MVLDLIGFEDMNRDANKMDMAGSMAMNKGYASFTHGEISTPVSDIIKREEKFGKTNQRVIYFDEALDMAIKLKNEPTIKLISELENDIKEMNKQPMANAEGIDRLKKKVKSLKNSIYVKNSDKVKIKKSKQNLMK